MLVRAYDLAVLSHCLPCVLQVCARLYVHRSYSILSVVHCDVYLTNSQPAVQDEWRSTLAKQGQSDLVSQNSRIRKGRGFF